MHVEALRKHTFKIGIFFILCVTYWNQNLFLNKLLIKWLTGPIFTTLLSQAELFVETLTLFSGMSRVLSPGHWAEDRRGSRRLVGASSLLTGRGAVLHSGVDEGRSTLGGHGQWHLLLFMLGQSGLYGFCVDIWDGQRGSLLHCGHFRGL